MSLKAIIDNDIKDAMRAKDQVTLLTLRAIKSAILLLETAEGQVGPISEVQEIQLLTKQANMRKDSAQQYRENNRIDLAEKEEAELAVLEKYLPKMMTEAELEAEIKALIAEVGATSGKDMGKVMGVATKRFAGKADGKMVSAKVKALLG